MSFQKCSNNTNTKNEDMMNMCRLNCVVLTFYLHVCILSDPMEKTEITRYIKQQNKVQSKLDGFMQLD